MILTLKRKKGKGFVHFRHISENKFELCLRFEDDKGWVEYAEHCTAAITIKELVDLLSKVTAENSLGDTSATVLDESVYTVAKNLAQTGQRNIVAEVIKFKWSVSSQSTPIWNREIQCVIKDQYDESVLPDEIQNYLSEQNLKGLKVPDDLIIKRVD